MSNNKKESIKEVSHHKKAAVLGIEKKKKKVLPYAVLSICGMLVIAAVIFFQGNVMSSQNSAVPQKAGEDNQRLSQVQAVTYPISLFDEGKAKHFEFRADNNVTIKYFVLKSSDGVIRAAFDACDVCWPSGKGYYQEQDAMVCRNCGKRFSSVKINEVKGGCNPAPLNRKIDGDNLVIQVADILGGKSYFDFSRGGNS
ncbi:MAG: DUF2318 domain-containing protein [Deltaproteobacteria bacterium]|nr:DUF2318 domain-containing protein [Deltaproteobacteria bacterium]